MENPKEVKMGLKKTVKRRGFHGNHIGARPNQVGNKILQKVLNNVLILIRRRIMFTQLKNDEQWP